MARPDPTSDCSGGASENGFDVGRRKQAGQGQPDWLRGRLAVVIPLRLDWGSVDRSLKGGVERRRSRVATDVRVAMGRSGLRHGRPKREPLFRRHQQICIGVNFSRRADAAPLRSARHGGLGSGAWWRFIPARVTGTEPNGRSGTPRYLSPDGSSPGPHRIALQGPDSGLIRVPRLFTRIPIGFGRKSQRSTVLIPGLSGHVGARAAPR